ncbi:hypothetical protein ACJJTC_005855 [Scirpophaga incertulas]
MTCMTAVTRFVVVELFCFSNNMSSFNILNISTDLDVNKLPKNCHEAVKYILDYLLAEINPCYKNIRDKFELINEENDGDIYKFKDLFILSLSQIKKCMLNFLEIFKTELRKNVYLKDTRQYILKRLTWCMSKLISVAKYFDQLALSENSDCEEFNEIINVPMYFVNWIDYTFDVLTKLADIAYKTNHRDNNELEKQWKEDMVDHIVGLHMCIDELLLSAVTLGKFCLDEDQLILKARCHVVLRETKALFNELVNVDITTSVKITQAHLKSPIMPSNINILIDVLKDSLYVLETNTNTALLNLLIHCYVCTEFPVDVLSDHFIQRGEHLCPCYIANAEDADIETCVFVNDFDLYNERLSQIGSFAVSCSSDQKRIVSLRSCLSSLESLDSHLVPAISTNTISPHTTLLMNFWKQEVMEIRDTVFLIVDPVAFVERCKTYMKELLADVEQKHFQGSESWGVIVNIGSLVHDFFCVYKEYEPDALIQEKEFDLLLENLNKAQKECKVVYNLLKIDKNTSNRVTVGTLTLRVRLLYSLVKKIHELIRPTDDEFFANELDEDANVVKNITHTVYNPDSMYSRLRPNVNVTRTIFARTATVIKPTHSNHILGKLTKHLQIRKVTQQELNFSEQVSELFDIELKGSGHRAGNTKCMSLRRTLFSQTSSIPCTKFNMTYNKSELDEKEGDDKFLNEVASLQISDILNQLNDITDVISAPTPRRNLTASSSRIRRVDENNSNSVSISSNVTQPSNVTTLERINDLDLVENKIHSLKLHTDLETDL